MYYLWLCSFFYFQTLTKKLLLFFVLHRQAIFTFSSENLFHIIAFLKPWEIFCFHSIWSKNIYSLYNTHVWVVMVSCYQELTEDFFMLRVLSTLALRGMLMPLPQLASVAPHSHYSSDLLHP